MTNQMKQQKPLIDINKKYKTRSGLDVRILCTDLKGTEYPVVCAVDYGDHSEVYACRTNGDEYLGSGGPRDLIEHNPWMDLKVDHPIIVGGHKRHFCKYVNGSVHYYPYGYTSYTSNEAPCITVEDNCTIATL